MRRAWLILFVPLVVLAPARPAAPPVPRVVRLTRDGSFKQNLQFSPDGARLLMTRIHKGKMGLWTVKSDGTDLRPLLETDPRTPHFDGHFSKDGKRVVFVLDVLQGTDGKLQINTCTADGKDSKTLIPHKAFEESPRFSPDGKRVLWVSTRHGNQELYSCAADGSDHKRLTNDPALDNAPCWSPDGKKIAFASSRSGNFEIHVMNADGTAVKRLTNNPALDTWPAWSPDGKRIAFTSNRDGNYEIYLMNADGSGLRNLTRHKSQDNFAAWSPDGKKIAFVSNRFGGHEICLTEVDELMRAALLVVLTSLAVGCASSPPAKPVVPFTLDAPPTLELLKGESPTFDVAVNWDRGERQDLTLGVTIEPDNRGVSARPVKARLERGVGPAQVVVTATETAAPGDYVLTISAKAESGAAAKTTIAVKVRAD